MKIPLSKRLAACAGFVYPGERIADVGCDHGYLSIHLLLEGTARSAIASDINGQPLLSARIHAEKYGVREKMEFYLSDGVKNIPRDFDTMICAGMGADTMISILEAAPWLKSSQYRLILQCQSKTSTLRRYLSSRGFFIAKEAVLRDGRFLYTVMEVLYRPENPRLTPGQCHFPPALLEDPGKQTGEYYRYVIQGLQIAAEHREDPQLHAALAELTEDPRLQFLKEETL